MTNGAILISFVLSNGTSRALNIVDDAARNLFLVLDAGTEAVTRVLAGELAPDASAIVISSPEAVERLE